MKFLLKPYKLCSNRVWRSYHGGKLIEEWQGLSGSSDGQFPEEWIASVVKARNFSCEDNLNEGLSEVESGDVCRVTLKQVIESDPERFLGKKHVVKHGNNMGMLTKIIDSSERLTIQVHPDRIKAKVMFDSNYGKTEAWYILGGRSINGEQPYVLLGFKPGITREKWQNLFERQDIEEMVNALNKFYIKQGQVFLIEGGIPHAIGPGCFLIEIQEPTDYTIRAERRTPGGLNVPDELCHQGVGFDRMFECFHYDTYRAEQINSQCMLKTITLHKSRQAKETCLIGYDKTPMFAMNSIEVYETYPVTLQDACSVLVVLSGRGLLVSENSEMEIRQGEQIFLPAGLKNIIIKSQPNKQLRLVRCFPPMQ